jgi:DNA-binding NarL/FixJ family response regulator
MSKITLGIVDDHDLFREGLQALLNSKEVFEVTLTANSGRDCLNQLKQTVPDVILLDLDMPEMDGIETLQEIIKAEIPTKVIILSMHQDQALILHLIEKGAHGYLLKHVSFDEISTAIDEVMKNGHYYNNNVIEIMRNGLKVKQRKAVNLNPQTTFTEREIEVLELICKEKTAQEIADTLFLSQRTIEGYKKNLLEKTNARNTTGMIIYCLKHGIIELETL